MDHSFIHFLYVMQAHHTHTHAAIATDSEPRLNVFFSVFLGIRARGRGRANTRCGGEIRNEKKSRPIDGENKTTPKIQHIHFFSLAKNNVSEGRRDEVEIGPFDARLVHFIYRPLPPPPPSLPLLCKWRYILFICANHIFYGCHTAVASAAVAAITSATATVNAEYRYFFSPHFTSACAQLLLNMLNFFPSIWPINVFDAVLFFLFFMLGSVYVHRSIHVASCSQRLTFHIQHVIFCLLLFSFSFHFSFRFNFIYIFFFFYAASSSSFIYMVLFAFICARHWCVVARCRFSIQASARNVFLLIILDTNL